MGRKKKLDTENETVIVQMHNTSENHFKALEAMNFDQEHERAFNFFKASIKDDLCNYDYEVIQGVGLGFSHKVKGKGIIEDDMKNAFAKLNVHLAAIDDIFIHTNNEFQNIQDVNNHELTFLYNVIGIEVKGGEENESVILTGNKYLRAASGSRMDLVSPKIPIDNLSSYKWYEDLKEAVDNCRREVALYHYGKFTEVEVQQPEEKFKQTTMVFAGPEGGEATGENEHDEDFENGKID